MYGMGTVYACPVCHRLLILRQIFVCILPSLIWLAPVLIYVVDPRFLSEFSASGFRISWHLYAVCLEFVLNENCTAGDI